MIKKLPTLPTMKKQFFNLCCYMIFAIFAINLVNSNFVFAQDEGNNDTNDKVPYRIYRGARPSGMGGAFEAIVDDINAFHYNPAGLLNNKYHFQILIVKLQPTEDTFSEVKELFGWRDDVKAIAQSDNPLDDPSLADERKSLVDRLERLIDESLGVDADLPAISLLAPISAGNNRFVIGGSLYTQTRLALDIERRGLRWRDPIVDMLDNAIFYETTGTLNVAGAAAYEIPLKIPMILRRASVGVAFRKSLVGRSLDNLGQPMTVADVINQNGADGIKGTDDDFENRFFDPDPNNILDSFKSISSFGIDLGTMVTPIEGLNAALVLRNAISRFSKEGEESKSYPSNLILSASANPFKLLDFFNTSRLDLVVAASVEDLTGSVSDLREKAKGTDKVHLGVEASFKPFIGLAFAGRIGNNQGFPTIGISARLVGFEFDISRFGDVENNWYTASVSLAF